jgi:hypothetical protein
MDARDRVRALQSKVKAARSLFEAGERMRALEEIDAALAIDPQFLAGRVLRDSILRSPLKTAAPAPRRDRPAQLLSLSGPNIDEDVAPQPLARHPRGSRSLRRAVSLLIAAVIAAASFGAGTWWARSHAATEAAPDTAAVSESSAAEPEHPAAAAPAAAPVLPAEVGTAMPARPPAVPGNPPAAASAAAAVPPKPSAGTDDESAVRQSIERFRGAYNVRAGSHGEAPVTFDGCDVAVDGEMATANCTQSGSRVWTFTLEKAGGAWKIKAIAG